MFRRGSSKSFGCTVCCASYLNVNYSCRLCQNSFRFISHFRFLATHTHTQMSRPITRSMTRAPEADVGVDEDGLPRVKWGKSYTIRELLRNITNLKDSRFKPKIDALDPYLFDDGCCTTRMTKEEAQKTWEKLLSERVKRVWPNGVDLGCGGVK